MISMVFNNTFKHAFISCSVLKKVSLYSMCFYAGWGEGDMAACVFWSDTYALELLKSLSDKYNTWAQALDI